MKSGKKPNKFVILVFIIVLVSSLLVWLAGPFLGVINTLSSQKKISPSPEISPAPSAPMSLFSGPTGTPSIQGPTGAPPSF